MADRTKARRGWIAGTVRTAGPAEAPLALGGDDDRGRLVGPVDRHLLGHVVGVGPGEPGGTHEDERLRRQVDVLLVLGAVAGDGLVAELGELDPDLAGGDPVDAVADDGPVAPAGRQLAGGLADRGPAGRGCGSRASGRSRSAASSAWRSAASTAPGRAPRRWRTPAGTRPRSGRRRPWWTRRSSPRRGRRRCRARRRTCR